MRRDQVDAIKSQYPVGTRVTLIFMDDRWAPPSGTNGTVTGFDDAGQVHVKWDTGSTLALIPGIDSFEVK